MVCERLLGTDLPTTSCSSQLHQLPHLLALWVALWVSLPVLQQLQALQPLGLVLAQQLFGLALLVLAQQPFGLPVLVLAQQP